MFRKLLFTLLLIVIASDSLLAQQTDCETSIPQAVATLERASEAFADGDLELGQPLVFVATAILASCVDDTDCPVPEEAIDILNQIITAPDAESASELLDAALFLLEDCNAETGDEEDTPDVEDDTVLAESDILFIDRFDDNRNDWETAANDYVFSDVVDGQYIMDYLHENAVWTIMPGWTDYSLAPIMESPYEVEVEFQILDYDTDIPGVGLAFNVKEEYQDYTMFRVYASGDWNVKTKGVDDWRDIGATNLSTDILDGRVHVIKMQVDFDQATLFLDDEIVASTPNSDIYGTAGFGVANGSYGSVTVAFDNFTIRDLSDTPSQMTESFSGSQLDHFENDHVAFDYPRGWYPHAYEDCDCVFITNDDDFYEYLTDNVEYGDWLYQDVDPGTVFIQILDDLEPLGFEIDMPLSLENVQETFGNSDLTGETRELTTPDGDTRTWIILDMSPSDDTRITFFEMDGHVANAMLMVDKSEHGDYMDEFATILGSVTKP